MRIKWVNLLAVWGLFWIAAAPAGAQGVLHLHEPGATIEVVPEPGESGIIIEPQPPDRIIIPPPGPPRPPRPFPPRPIMPPQHLLPAELTSLEVRVEIDGQLAKTALDQSFRNPNSRRLEGTYLFPLPPNAAVKDLSLYIDGKPVKCEVLDAKKARQIYEDIVRQMRDPALLEYVGRDLVKLRIFPIEPGQVRRVKFEYSQVLRRDFAMTDYTLPLVPRSAAGRPVGHFSLSGSIRSDLPLTAVYSPTHDIEFIKKDDRTVKFSVEQENKAPATDLRIYYAVSQKDLGAGLVTWRKGGEDGYFMLMIAPRREVRKGNVLPKDVTFVFDTSGSMQGEKIEQAKKALEFCLNGLHEKDRFNVIRFSTETEALSPTLLEASPDSVKKALEFVRGLEATGGTNIQEALLTALKSRPKDKQEGRPYLIVFLTDGKPTVGETNPDAIVKAVTGQNKESGAARVFAFGVDNEVNTVLLDKLSGENGGVSEYVTPREDIEVKVSNFFTKASDPILTALELNYGGIRVSQQYPSALPDLFAGSQLTIIGRYKEAGKTSLVLSGRMGEDKKTYEYELDFPEQSESGDFLPRLWAIRRVGYLMDEIRKNGENEELKDEIIRLGKKYAIATPYTSLLVQEDEIASLRPANVRQPVSMPQRGADAYGMGMMNRAEGVAAGRGGAAAGAPGVSYDSYAKAAAPGEELRAKSGPAAVEVARHTRVMKESDRFSKDLASSETREMAGRTFLLRGGVWTDSEYDGKAETVKITYGSDAYFELLGKGGDIGKFLALGTRVIFRLENKWYQIVEETKENVAK